MNRILTVLFFSVLLFTACRNPMLKGVSKEYDVLIQNALEIAGNNRSQIEQALLDCEPAQKEGMAFLIAYMPEHDLQQLSSDFLLENVHYAYKAKQSYSWAKALPDSIFFNEVLPYAVLNETRDNWRSDFYNRFSKYVVDAPNIFAAIDSVNKHIRNELLVDYNTKREKPDQSPYESMRQGMASCSGLSILLTDALRSVGIPSRIGGTPNWHDHRGNHNWNEVWADGQWYFTEYYPSGLNKSWFLADAGKADGNDPETSIYASSWKTTGSHFPLVWDRSIRYVPGINVTERYVALYNAEKALEEAKGNKIALAVSMYRNNTCSLQGDNRVAANVDLFCGEEQVGGGRTSGPTNDMNDVLTFYIDKNKTYSLKYPGSDGFPKIHEFASGEENLSIRLFWEE